MAKRKQENVNDVVQILGGAKHYGKRESNDFYATPTKAVTMLMNSFNELNPSFTVMDPCVGKGHVLKPFRDAGYNVLGKDLIGRTDYFDQTIIYPGNNNFLEDTSVYHNTNIITNPPYEFCKEFAEKAIQLIDQDAFVIMLLKIQFLETKARYELFKKYPPKYVYVFVNRIGCIPGGENDQSQSSAICYAWYIWQKGFTGEPTLRWLSDN